MECSVASMKHVSKKRLSCYILLSMLTTSSTYSMWDKLQQLAATSKQYDFAKTTVGIAAIGSLAYYAYLLQQEFWIQENNSKVYLSYVNGTCLYIIDKKADGVTITRPWPETRSLEDQHQQTLALATYFQKRAKRLERKLQKASRSGAAAKRPLIAP
jgi:hypothetical protein